MDETVEYNRRVILSLLPFLDDENLIWLAKRVADELEGREKKYGREI